MKDLTKFAEKAEFQLTAKQKEAVQKVFNLAGFHNNSAIVSQIHNNGLVKVRYLTPFQAMVIYVVLRLLGIQGDK